ncbi:hypothetical protein MJO28_012823 [Puccinia striiformis f. sp. tritici]|uniref:Uncharacterized protein n=2 Tax=Puccinia striiformis f. sp. tritici TaxID=168172 RepID=A0A0L0UPU8_9BASI|nr:hypothetical protein Pst134EB_025333 [Puccinia striiformis f. sp. tritici]KAI9625323.1 hypothetical protein H4Q26_016346 [Puccinia striiformis f. sp. tritici PST-130]KNE89043.1 hypothetical protein PSTG_17498 [Puccinia striiformis f. sp. tritici PST-78]KAI7940538.1 hypothetical protein MJO28_012823 [Puccinia striiformis f. sp. tritici]KAI7943399.1 hypothetical protein MJO29_013243 [Puccinia striiformis f. sp. tritici]
MITQLFTGAWSVEVGYTDHTHKLSIDFQLLILFGQGIVYALTVVVGLILILSHELLQKGYDLLLGTSLFIATNIFESITWKAISPTTINIGRGPQFGGALIACSIFHVEQQNWTIEEGLLPRPIAECDELECYRRYLCGCDLPPRFPSLDSGHVRPIQGPTWYLPRQALLHFQHPDHA